MTTTPDNFADTPPSITEIKAERFRCGTLWTPRDVLVNLLRDIDKGNINADTLVVVFRQTNPDGRLTSYTVSSSSLALTLGCMEIAKSKMLKEV